MPGALTRSDAFGELGGLRSRFDPMCDGIANGRECNWAPAIDVVREIGNLVIGANLPPIKPEMVKIEVEDDVLALSGEHDGRKEQKDEHVVRRERRYGSFSRSMVLPAGADVSKIRAQTHDGTLEMTIPALAEATQQRVSVTATAG
jgi:HSP20 family protein